MMHTTHPAEYLFLYNYNLKDTSGVYALVNVAEYRWYIGSARDMMRRADQHFSLLHKNQHPNYKLRIAYQLYGPSVFSIVVLERCPEDSLARREAVWIQRLWRRAYNLTRKTDRPDIKNLVRHKLISTTKRRYK